MRILANSCRIVLIAALIMLSACNRISQSNYDKINTGMTMQQVTAILGEPSNVESINFMGFSGSSATWRNKNDAITIQFLNNQAQVKSFNKTDNETQ